MSTEVVETTAASVIRLRRCPKCGTTIKSGVQSCCARGGAWFKKCGYPGDTNFEHTWDEGFRVCSRRVENPTSGHHARIIHHPTNAAGLQSTTGKYRSIYSKNSMASITDCANHLEIAKFSKFVSLVLISLCLQKLFDLLRSPS